MFRFWDLCLMSWLFQVVLNYLFIILPVYAVSLGASTTEVGQMFAVNIGVRFFPNALVTKLGTRSEIPMWTLALVGFIVSYVWPTQPWALYIVAAGAGCAFTRACVSLHTQQQCAGNVEALTLASKRCGAARSLGDISGFILPTVVYKFGGWRAFVLFGCILTASYLMMALVQLYKATPRSVELVDKETFSLTPRKEREDNNPSAPIAWIDWAISAAFISTELQMNLFITAVPQALLHRFDVPPTYVGMVVGAGALATLVFIMALPCFPSIISKHRPVNLILSYTGMFFGWVLMSAALAQPQATLFMVAAYFYQSMVGASQIVMLECLTGICDSTNSAKILGVAEMVGCAFGMVGGYAGEALLDFGIGAPFLLGLVWTFVSVTGLSLSFVLRQTQRDRIPAQWALDPEKAQQVEQRLVTTMAAGLHKMVLERQNSFISSEIEYRRTETTELKSLDVLNE